MEGCPRGPSSLIIFNMVVNEVHHLDLDNAQVLSYADDIAIVVTHPSQAIRLAQRALDAVSEKCKSLGLKISDSKTTAVNLFSHTPRTPLKLDGVDMEWQKFYKYLGSPL